MAIYVNGRKVDIPGSENGDVGSVVMNSQGVTIQGLDGEVHSFPNDSGITANRVHANTVVIGSNITINGNAHF